MPNIHTPSSSPSQGSSRPQRKSTYSGLSSDQVVGAGRVTVNISDPNKSLQENVGNLNAGFIGMGKGLVSIAENLPVVGAVAKPVIGLVGGVLDNTIGRGVSFLEQIRIGDSNLAQAAVSGLETVGTPLKWGLDALLWPGQQVEKKVAEARIINTRSGKSDFITSVFGNASASAVNAVANGATIEQAAEQLAQSNAGFSQDGAHNFLWSVLLDPVNFASFGIGKGLQVGAKASQLNAFIVNGSKAELVRRQALVSQLRASGGRVAAKGEAATSLDEAIVSASTLEDNIRFAEKYEMAGKIYDGLIAKLPFMARKYSTKVAIEAVRAIDVVHNSKVSLSMASKIEKQLGKKVANTGLRNFAITSLNAIKAGSIRSVTGIRRGNSEATASSLVTYLEDGLRQGKSAEELLTKSIDGSTRPWSDVIVDSFVKGKQVGKGLEGAAKAKAVDEATALALREQQELAATIQGYINQGVRADELLRKPEVSGFIERFASAHADFSVVDKVGALQDAGKLKASLDSKVSIEEMVRVMLESKNDRIASAANPARAVAELTEDLISGFGAPRSAAEKLARELVDEYKGSVKDLADVLSIARGAAFGQAARELSAVRKMGLPGIFSRVTIISARSLTESKAKEYVTKIDGIESQIKVAEAAGDTKLVSSLKNELRVVADELVFTFDDFAANYPVGKYTYNQVFDFLRKVRSEKIAVRELTEKEGKELIEQAVKEPKLEAVKKVKEKLESMGYRLGIAPSDNISRTPILRVSSATGQETWDDALTPFSDLIDFDEISSFDNAIADSGLRRSGLARIWDKASRKYGPEIVKNNISERFVTSLVQKGGMSVNRARSILVQINALAVDVGVQSRALFMERKQVLEFFTRDELDALVKAGTDPIAELIRAAGGDWSIGGLTTGFSQRTKALFPAITILTDRIYPEVRFGVLNPFFNLVLERSETALQLQIHGIKRQAADEALKEVRGKTLLRAYRDKRNVTHEIVDNVLYVQSRQSHNMTQVALASNSLRQRVTARAKGWLSINSVRDAKVAAAEVMSDEFAKREFIDLFEQAAPGRLNELALHFGLTNTDEVVEALLTEYIMQSRPDLLAKLVAQEGKLARSLTQKSVRENMESSYLAQGMSKVDARNLAEKNSKDLANTIMTVYEVAIERGARLADEAQYFANQRTWLERSLNHPFLGLYPYSYMTRKAIPWLTRVLFAPRAGDLVLPGFGYVQWQKAIEWSQNRVNTDEDVLGQILQNDAVLYVFSTILPVTPDSVGFSTPTWLRRSVTQPGLRGKDLTVGEIAPALSEIGQQFWRGTAFGQTRTVLEGIQSAQDITKVNKNLGEIIETGAEDLGTIIDQRLRQP